MIDIGNNYNSGLYIWSNHARESSLVLFCVVLCTQQQTVAQFPCHGGGLLSISPCSHSRACVAEETAQLSIALESCD